jgi:multicomponent Na+:H+ antiporter subunit D
MELSSNWLGVPILMPLMAAAIMLVVFRMSKTYSLLIQRTIAAVALTFNLGLALVFTAYTVQQGRLVLQMGLWAAPFGITMVLDGLSAIMLTLTAILAAVILPYAIGTLDARERMNFYPVLLFLVAGVNGAFLAGDLFNLYVFFEVLLMASFVLLTLGGTVGQVRGGIRYVLLNLIASIIFLTAAGVAYGTLGTLNLAHLALRLESAPVYLQFLLAGLLMVAFSSKAGLFPLFFWLPASYHTTHPAVTAFFGGLLTKVGIYTLFRFFPLLFPNLLLDWQPLILAVAGFTMLTGVFGAMAVNTVRRVLSFHVISQVGYMVMGLGVAASGNQLAVGFGMAAGILYLVHHMIVKTALLMAGGAAELEAGSGNLVNGKLRGLSNVRPVLAVIFFIAAMSLAGIPPSSGFVAKLSLLQITLDSGQWAVAFVSVVVSIFTMMSMARLWQYGFWGEKPAIPSPYPILASRRSQWLILSPIAFLIVLSLSIGLFTEPFFQLSRVAAEQVMDRQGYIEAVNIPADIAIDPVVGAAQSPDRHAP